jgi:hypothetical protein
MNEIKTTRVQLLVLVDPEVKARLQAEALDRVRRGEASRMDVSAITRDALADHLRKSTPTP